MRRFISPMIVAVLLFLAVGSTTVHGQVACGFQQGFATLRALVGEEKVGACREDEHVNDANGNTEQQTTGGLLVWRKADNFTAFTDGGTTWVNGPNGLQSRPNDERLAWEQDPAPGTPPRPTPRPLPTLPVTTPISVPLVASTGGSIASPYDVNQARTSAPQLAPVSSANPTTTATTTTGAATPTPTPTSSPSSTTAGVTRTPAPVGASTSTTTSAAAATSTTTATPTKTPTPKPAVTAKFSERVETVETGNDVQFEVQTSAKKGTCALIVTYRSTSEANMGGKNIDDGHCDWKFTLPANTKTGKATAVVTITAATGETVTLEDSFTVKKGDTIYAGSIDLEVDATDLPDSVNPGEEVKVGIDTNLKRKGSCSLVVTWPKVGPVSGETQMPDDSGKCSWKVKAPADLPTKTSATLVITVYKDSATLRTLTKDFKVGK